MTSFALAVKPNSPQEASFAAGEVTEAVKEFSEALIARVKNKSASGGKTLTEGQRLKKRLQQLCDQVYEAWLQADKDLKAQITQLVTQTFPEWVRMMDDLLAESEVLQGILAVTPRPIRRKRSKEISEMNSTIEDAKALREMMLEFLERIDPTPDDYLESEVRARHGNDADRLMQGFESIATSDAFTLEAFKKRHNLC